MTYPADSVEPLDTLSWWGRTFISVRQYRDYRLVWLGSVSEHMGEWMELVALSWLMWEMTHSAFLLGLVGFFRLIPMSVFSMVGGVTADRMDRKRLLIAALFGSALVSVGLAILVNTGVVAVWHLLAASLLSGILTSFNHPARQTIVPNVVPREQLMNAISLDSFSVLGTRIIGPSLAGYLIDRFGAAPVFGTRAVGALVAIWWLSGVRMPLTPPEARRKTPWHNLGEGFRYLGENRMIMALAALYLIPMFFSWAYQSVLPVFADQVFHAGALGLGYLNTASGVGSMVSLLSLASARGAGRRKGRVLFRSGLFLGVALALFAGSRWLLPSLVLLAAVGAFVTTFQTVNNTLIQSLIPDELRGRVTSMREMAMGIGAPVGSLLIGVLADRSGAPPATAVFGLMCLVVVTIAARSLPKVRRL